MRNELLTQVYAGLAQFSSASRLYELKLESEGEYGSGGLLVGSGCADVFSSLFWMPGIGVFFGFRRAWWWGAASGAAEGAAIFDSRNR